MILTQGRIGASGSYFESFRAPNSTQFDLLGRVSRPFEILGLNDEKLAKRFSEYKAHLEKTVEEKSRRIQENEIK